jgi:nicotinamide-nucleotide amidase
VNFLRAEIVSVGTELLLGNISDTNATFIARRLSDLGIDCFYVSQVGDNVERIAETIVRGLERSDLVVTTGGLGPTEDDLTRDAIALVAGERPFTEAALEAELRERYRRRGSDMPVRNLRQAQLIPSAKPLSNPVGTAPGWWVRLERQGSLREIVTLPGVPFEMRRMWAEEIEPQLRGRSGSTIVSRTLKVLGMGESNVDEAVADLMSSTNPTLAPYAKEDGVHLRITAKTPGREEANALIGEMEAAVRARFGNAIYGVDDERPAAVVRGLLGERGLNFALLEVGRVAHGALSGLLNEGDWATANSSRCLGAVSLEALGESSALFPQASLASSLLEAATALADLTKAQAVVATSASSRATEGLQGAVDIEANTIVILDGQVAANETQRWRTDPGQASRLVGLMALNALRVALLGKR